METNNEEIIQETEPQVNIKDVFIKFGMPIFLFIIGLLIGFFAGRYSSQGKIFSSSSVSEKDTTGMQVDESGNEYFPETPAYVPKESDISPDAPLPPPEGAPDPGAPAVSPLSAPPPPPAGAPDPSAPAIEPSEPESSIEYQDSADVPLEIPEDEPFMFDLEEEYEEDAGDPPPPPPDGAPDPSAPIE